MRKGKFSKLESNIISVIKEFKNELNYPKLLAIIRERKILHRERRVIFYGSKGEMYISTPAEMEHLNPLMQNMFEAGVFRKDIKGRYILLNDVEVKD